MKPRIVASRFGARPEWRWACFAGLFCGFGNTPREAYDMWWNATMRAGLQGMRP